ncbi:MAG: signal peptidase I [Gammaproteobacteria bacterium]|nr:MAG: signal peptidase I [Gammaproteobacteria bacterium]
MNLDFPTIMVLLVVVTGGIWAFDAVVLAPRRRLSVAQGGDGVGEGEAEIGPGDVLEPPKLVEYARSFFPIFLIVLLLRSFLVEPFRIPSGSMMPTLLIGDFILVNKYTYGIRLPIMDKKIIEIGRPERGDVVVFRFPEDPTIPFIKRIVGLPGDRISYYNKTLYINGEPAPQEKMGTYTGYGSGSNMTGTSLRAEYLDDAPHVMLVQGGQPGVEGEIVVPEENYFVLGDNRDNSRDSRYWGTVPDDHLIGRAFTIWMNWDWGEGIDWGRIGTSIK